MDLISNLVIYLYKSLIVGDFNTHFDNICILDSVKANHNIIGLNHNGGHTLDQIVTFGLNIENIVTIPQSMSNYLKSLSNLT